MKLKILTETNYERIQEMFNKFAEVVSVLKVEVSDNNGMVIYHVFYQEKPWRD